MPPIEKGRRRSTIPHRPWGDPVFRWAGSKRRLVPMLLRASPKSFECYIEPFAGSACLFFALRPRNAVLGDINSGLIETYSIIQKHPRILQRAVKSLPDTNEEYLRQRNLSPDSLSPFERATRFVYLNRHCFNGVYRENQAGKFNVPRGSKTGELPDERSFVRCSLALRQAKLVNDDFESLLSKPTTGNFYYLDPPYALASRFRGEYGYGAFNREDIARLLLSLQKIHDSGALFLLSYSNDPNLLSEIAPDWYIHHLSVRRHVAGFVDHRRLANEILVTNYKTSLLDTLC